MGKVFKKKMREDLLCNPAPTHFKDFKVSIHLCTTHVPSHFFPQIIQQPKRKVDDNAFYCSMDVHKRAA